MLSPEIIEARLGCITASKAHSIMAGWDTPRPSLEFPVDVYDWIAENERKPLVNEVQDQLKIKIPGKTIEAAWKAYQYDKVPQGLLTYAEELACEELFEYDPSLDFVTKHTENGNEREVDAVEELIKQTGLQFAKIGDDQIHITANGIGATPDGIVYDDLDLISTGCEVKCRSPIHHARQLLINDNASLIEHDFERYCQIQAACLVAEVDHWYSVNYNPFGKEDAIRFHYCIIKRDDAFIKILKQRANVVYEHKAHFLRELLKATNVKTLAAA